MVCALGQIGPAARGIKPLMARTQSEEREQPVAWVAIGVSVVSLIVSIASLLQASSTSYSVARPADQ
jgi:hypothetical protein